MDDGKEHLDLTPDAAAPAPGHADAVVSIAGILGKGAGEDSVRIYLDAAFSTFYDIPRDAVTDRRRVAAADSAFGVPSTVLHIKQGTRITVQHTSSRTIDHEFLAGDFTAPSSFHALAWAAPAWSRGRASGDDRMTSSRYRTSPDSPGCTLQPKAPCQI